MSLVGHLGISDLGDKRGSEPVRVSNFDARRLDRRSLLFQGRHDLHQARELGGIKACADFSGVAQCSPIMHAEDQGPKGPALVGGRPAGDHEFLALDALGFHPTAGARSDVYGVRELGDDALEARGTKALEQLLAISRDMIREANMRVLCGENAFQPGFPFKEREIGQILAIELEQVKSEIVDARWSALERALQSLKVRSPLGIEHDSLAIDQRGADLELARLREDRGEAIGPIESGAGVGTRLARADSDQSAIAVIFHLVDPAIAGRNGIDERCELDGAECRRRRRRFLGRGVLRAARDGPCTCLGRRHHGRITCPMIEEPSSGGSSSSAALLPTLFRRRV